MNLVQLWDQLVDCICRPPRDRYTVDDLIGGERHRFMIGAKQGIREDMELVNKSGQKLQCSHYKPAHVKEDVLPCVIYCHCNSGSRRDAEEAIILLIPQGISVFCMDFAGSGLSEGEWVTLGAREVDDLEVVVTHLRASGKTSTIGLWGRSMGAVTAILYCKRDPSVAGVVLDSPFSRLHDLMLELVQEQQIPIPRPFVRVALAAMRRSVRKRAGFDIYQVSPLESVNESFVPVLFGHATGDTFIKMAHSEKLHEKYAGDKNLITFEGDHNSRRPQFFYNSASIFFHNVLQVDGSRRKPHASEEDQMSATLLSGDDLQLNTSRSSQLEMGETNIPWNPTWTGDKPTTAEVDEMFWAASVHARTREGNSSDRSGPGGGVSCDEDGIGDDHPADPAWYEMLPESSMAEESMLQAALAASLEEAKLREHSARATNDSRNPPMPIENESPTGAANVARQVDFLHNELGTNLSSNIPTRGQQQQ